MNRKLCSLMIMTLLVLGIISIMPTTAQNEAPVISVINPSNETADFVFASNTPVGYKFNVTANINEGTDVAAWQVTLNYNTSILNATRGFIPTLDTQYIFYGRSTVAPNASFVQAGSVKIGDTTEPLVGVDFISAKKLAIIEFEVSAKPPTGIGNSVSCTLGIDNTDTFILNSNVTEIGSVKKNGYYELNNKQASQVSLSVNPTSLNVGGNVTLNGTISTVPANLSEAFPNTQVTLWHRVGTTDAFTALTTVFTDSTSRYSYTMLNPAFGVHQFESSWDGNSTYQGSYSGILTIRVNRLNSNITLTANPTSVQQGSIIELKGSITPPRPGANVTIYSGKTIVATVSAASNGSFSYSWTTTGAGTFVLTAKWGGDATYNGAVSKSVTVNVTTSPWLYIIIGIAAIAIVIALVAFYMRRRSKTPIQRKPSRPSRTRSVV